MSVRAAPILAAARCPGYWWECLQEARVLGLSACGPRQPLDGAAPAGRVSSSSAPAPPLAPRAPLRASRAHSDGAAVAVSGSGDHHGSSPPVGVMWHPETKNRLSAGSSEALGGGTPWTSGNRVRRDRATENPTSLAALGHSDKLITPPCLPWLTPWRYCVPCGMAGLMRHGTR